MKHKLDIKIITLAAATVALAATFNYTHNFISERNGNGAALAIAVNTITDDKDALYKYMTYDVKTVVNSHIENEDKTKVLNNLFYAITEKEELMPTNALEKENAVKAAKIAAKFSEKAKIYYENNK